MRKDFIIIIILVLLIGIPYLYSTIGNDRSYTIPKATVDLYVQQNGSLEVTENLHYSFKGTYNGIYRDIPMKTGERIENVNVTTIGAYSSPSVTNNGSIKSIKVYLYNNDREYKPITDKDVDVIIKYEVINATTIYNDIAEV